MEMGRRWQTEDFPKMYWRIWRWFWRPRMALHGFFNMQFFWHVVILHGCAVGGGSIAYANTLVEPREGSWENGSWASLADWRSEMPVHQEREIAVGLHNSHVVPSVLMAQARETAARIYATIGVKLRWRSRPETRIWMQFDTHVPPADHPGAMGYATPYDKTGTSIHILLDRVLCAGSQRLQGVLAGYVMAHELGHVLEGLSRHSDSGVMKAHWNNQDFDEILTGSFTFSSADTDLIQMGVARHSKATLFTTAEKR